MGLGNPGPEYKYTRHNAGFWAIDQLAESLSTSFTDLRRTCQIGESITSEGRIVLANPRTYVTESGLAAKYLLDRFKVEPSQLLVIYADMALRTGKLRLRASGRTGGHNGMNSIVTAITVSDLPRLRLGIGRPETGKDTIAHVLGPPSEADLQAIMKMVSRVPEIVDSILTEGVVRTMDWANRD